MLGAKAAKLAFFGHMTQKLSNVTLLAHPPTMVPTPAPGPPPHTQRCFVTCDQTNALAEVALALCCKKTLLRLLCDDGVMMMQTSQYVLGDVVDDDEAGDYRYERHLLSTC